MHVSLRSTVWLASFLFGLAACGGGGKPPAHAASGETPDTFYESAVTMAKTKTPTVEHSMSFALLMVNEKNGARFSRHYVGLAGPQRLENGKWILGGAAYHRSTGKIVSTLAIVLPSIAPDAYVSEGTGRDLDIGIALDTADWVEDAPATLWSHNGASAHVTITAIAGTKHLEGTITGKAVANEGAAAFRIEKGYFYVNP